MCIFYTINRIQKDYIWHYVHILHWNKLIRKIKTKTCSSVFCHLSLGCVPNPFVCVIFFFNENWGV